MTPSEGATRSAPAASSMRNAAVDSSVSISRAARRRSRTPTPPERSSGGGVAPQNVIRASTRRRRSERGPARGAVDGVGVAVADVQRRRVEGEGAERPVAAEREPDLAGQLDGLLVDPQ